MKNEELFDDNFFKQFKTGDELNGFLKALQKRGIEKMLEGELDGHLDYEEMVHLNQLCRGFMLPEKRVRELQMASKLFLLDRHFQNLKESKSGRELRDSFEAKAQDWGLDDQQLQTLRSWYPEELSDL